MSRPATGFAFLDDVRAPAVLAMAHRGGAEHPDLIGLENTAAAFRHAVELGYEYLETDVHLTASGDVVAFHDAVLDRVTDRSGTIATASQEIINAARIGGEHPIPRLADLFDEFPDCRFNVDLKADGTAGALADLIQRTGAYDRVCVGSFSAARLREFRARCAGRVATSAAPAEVIAFMMSPAGAVARRLTGSRVAALQIPYRHRGFQVVTPGLVRRAHAAGAQVHVWTIDDPTEMDELIQMGVDGLITDRTDVLKDVLVSRGLWSSSR